MWIIEITIDSPEYRHQETVKSTSVHTTARRFTV